MRNNLKPTDFNTYKEYLEYQLELYLTLDGFTEENAKKRKSNYNFWCYLLGTDAVYEGNIKEYIKSINY